MFRVDNESENAAYETLRFKVGVVAARILAVLRAAYEIFRGFARRGRVAFENKGQIAYLRIPENVTYRAARAHVVAESSRTVNRRERMAGGFYPRIFVIIYRNVVARSALRTASIVIFNRGSLRAVAENSSYATTRVYIADSSRTDFSVRGNSAASDIEHGVVERIADVISRSVAAGLTMPSFSRVSATLWT